MGDARANHASVGDNCLVIAAVTFDFWNTIAQVPPGAMVEARRRAVAAACEACGADVKSDLLKRALEEVRLRWEESWASGRHLHPRDGAQMFTRALGISEDARGTVAEAFLGALDDAPLELSPHIHACLEALAERGLALGIVCDAGFSGGEVLRGLLAREDLLGHFHGWAFSDEVGHYKPSAQIFQAALATLDAQPAEALHVGDLRRTDVAGAAALGMKTVRYTGMQNDTDTTVAVEADFIVDSHQDLPAIVDRLMS
jgi:FMN phosphatase YigB (HAD superfamily)